jgi:hypothetical protein
MADGALTNDELLRVWERAIQTQMHFAELSIKTRQVGLTVVGAALGLAIVLHRTASGYFLIFCSVHVPISSVLCWAAAVVLGAIWILDVGVYHRMLRGSVAFNEELEQKKLLGLFGTQLGLTQAISHFSRHPGAEYRDGKYEKGEARRHYAGNRISLFYLIMSGALIVAGIALAVAGVQ